MEIERELLEDRLCPALRAPDDAAFGASPQALLPMSVPYTRWRTDHAGRTFGGLLLCKGTIVCADHCRDPCAGTPTDSPSRSLNRKPHQFGEVRLKPVLKVRSHIVPREQRTDR